MVTNLMMSAKMATLGFLKRKVFWGGWGGGEGVILTFVEVTGEKLVGGQLFDPQLE